MFRIWLVISLISAASSLGDSKGAQIKRVKKATALVINPENGHALGTAFCVDTAGYYITTKSIADRGSDDTVVLVLNSGTGKQRRLSARVVRVDTQVDLALLLAEKTGGKALTLDTDAHLREKTAVTACGHSFSPPESANAQTRPIFAANAGHITALHGRSGTRQQIEIDALFNPGIVGGPLLDADGRVVGIVASDVGDTGVHQATPVSTVHAFLSKPLLHADFPKSVPWSSRYQPRRLKVSVAMLTNATQPDELRLSLSDGKDEHLLHAVKAGPDYLFETPLRTNQDTPSVNLHLKLYGTILNCSTRDVAFRVRGETLLLSNLISYERGKGFLTRDGRTLPFAATDETLTVSVAENTIEISMREVIALTVSPIAEATYVRYHLAAYTNGVASASLEGEIRFSEMPDRLLSGASASFLPVPIQPHVPFSDIIERSLPAPITDMTLAGSGRYMLLRMDKLGQVAVFDVVNLEVVKTLPLPEPKTLVAGGASFFVTVQPEQKILRLWSLRNFTCTLTKSLALTGPIVNIGMGYGSEGPLLVHTMPDEHRIDFIDLQTFDPIPHLTHPETRVGSSKVMRHRFSADGRTIGMWSVDGLEVYTPFGTKPSKVYKHIDAGYVAPSPDGAYIYTIQGIFGPNEGKISASPDKFMMIPSTQTAYYLGAVREDHFTSKSSPVQLSLFVRNSSRPLVDLPKTPEVKISHRGYLTGDLMLDQLVHFVPQAKVLITIPAERNRVVARYVDIDTLLNEADRDYFFVDSAPVTRIAQGARYRYRIGVKAKNQTIEYTLHTGPTGMKIDAFGLLSWNVQSNVVGSIPVVVGLRNGDGLERFHAFYIEVEP